MVGILASLAAGWFGFSLGVESRVDASPNGDTNAPSPEEVMNQQLNRLMLELWKMEDLERQRR